jgi:hypothetical protein
MSRHHHIGRRLAAAHRARNHALLELLAISDLPLPDVDTIVRSLAAEALPPADPAVVQLLRHADQPELANLCPHPAPAETPVDVGVGGPATALRPVPFSPA